MRHLKNIDLESSNTFGVSCLVDDYYVFESEDEMIRFSSLKDVFILGGGSNIVLPERLNVPVIKLENSYLKAVRLKPNVISVHVGAGMNWHELVTKCVTMGWGGIENLALIPGSVGAAPIQNIGAYGVELCDVFASLTAYNRVSGKMETFCRRDCQFGYRESVFKKSKKNKYIITSVQLYLTKTDHKLNTSYYALEDELSTKGALKPTIRDIYEAVISIRSRKLPDPEVVGNCGSFFKNPIIKEDVFNKLLKSFPDLKYYKLGGGEFKLPAGYLIESCGWKGKSVGPVGCFEKQALILINKGGATQSDVKKFVQMIKKSVFQKFGIRLSEEVNIVNEV